MKRMLYSFATGVILTAGVLLSLVAFAQDSLLGFVRPLVVDIRQAVPVVADVVVPLEDGECDSDGATDSGYCSASVSIWHCESNIDAR